MPMEWFILISLLLFVGVLTKGRNEVLRYLLWRPLGIFIFKHRLSFEAMPFRQALSLLGHTLAFTHSKAFYLLTYSFNWRQISVKKSPIFRLGVVGGTAQSASSFMLATEKSPYAELAAIGSRTKERGKACCFKYSIPTAYSPYERLLNDPTIDGVVVFCPISTHEELTKSILDAGKHAVCIPPAAANAKQMRRVLEYQRERHPGLLCMSAYPAIAHPVNRQMREIIRRGDIGTVRVIKITAFWPPHAFNSDSIQFQFSLAGGAWEDLGPHCITLARFMLGESRGFKATERFSVLSAKPSVPPFEQNVDESMHAQLAYGDVLLDIEVSFVKPMEMTIVVTGSDGILTQTQWYRPEMYNRLIHRKLDGTTVFSHEVQASKEGRASWEYLLDYIVNAFQSGEMPPLGSGEEELQTVEIIDEVYRKCGLGVRCPDN